MNNRDFSGQFQDNDRAESEGHTYDPELHQHYRDYRALQKEFTRKLIEAEELIDRMKGMYRK